MLNYSAQPKAGFIFRRGGELLFYFFIEHVSYFVVVVLYNLARCHTPIYCTDTEAAIQHQTLDRYLLHVTTSTEIQC